VTCATPAGLHTCYIIKLSFFDKHTGCLCRSRPGMGIWTGIRYISDNGLSNGTFVAYNDSIIVTYPLKIIKFLKFSAGKNDPSQTQWNIYVAKQRTLFVRHLTDAKLKSVNKNSLNFMFCSKFYVLLAVHSGTTLGKWPTWRTITLYKTFIIIILYMFRATLCSSSGGRIVLIQHLI
jgi:hypothetical protein